MLNYTIEEWFRDYGFAVQLARSQDITPDALTPRLLDYFCSKYRDDPTTRCHLLMQATRFVESHMDELSVGGVAVAGERECIVAEPLLRALHEYFTALTDLNRMPSVNEIIEIAKTHGA